MSFGRWDRWRSWLFAFLHYCRKLCAAVLRSLRIQPRKEFPPVSSTDSFGMQELPADSHTDAAMYATRMEEVRTRLARIETVVARIKREQKQNDGDIELIFIQFRKCCELIALGSLIANKKAYSEQYSDFANDWRLNRIVPNLRKVNPEFYPVPLSEPQTSPGAAKFSFATPGFLTEAELVQLYNIAGKLLHSRNPFSTDDPMHNIGYSVDEWVLRIKKLIRWHYIQQTESSRWLVQVPNTGDVHVYPAIPNPPTDNSMAP